MSAATRLRRLLPQADIVVLERSGYVSFANCGLPYYIGGVIEDRSALLLQTPQALAKRFGLDVRVHHEVTHIDPQRRCVQARTPDGSVASVEYDALVLSPGATPVRPPIPGIERALMLRDIEDTDALARACAGAQNAVVIGGGFIGVELAENLVHAGIEVALIESAPQVMTPLDPEMAAPVHERLRERGVELRLASAVSEVRERSVVLNDGTHLAADLVVAAVGVRPDVALAHLAGLRIGERGGILVDDYGRTSDPAIYAVGDAVEKRDLEDGSAVLVPLANTANLQGRRVADVIAGRPRPVRPVQATAIIGIFGLQVATTGWSWISPGSSASATSGRWPRISGHSYPSAQSRGLLPRSHHLDPEGAHRSSHGPHSRRSSRGGGRRGQADRRHRHGDACWPDGQRAR